ncbi:MULTISPECIES: hypothetical protein [Mumia]|uniref:hypothetical protein n=1 Tax=Mumia TaxID=1546255 RepID=UPI00141FEC58|nr:MULTISPECIES: hypothetical protein [unclassified Mumia]QMW65998.1 hypothetical protein H4N58_17900 [Mumia sp. ZJ1417]
MRTLAAAAALLVGAALPVLGTTQSAHAADGVCTDASGTTVVVDFTDLGGDVEVKCAEDSAGMTGMQALEAAGFEVTPVTGSGMTGACRIDGQPAEDEALDLDGRRYTEKCQEFPPGGAYWSFYVAPADGTWAYAAKGADVNASVPGGYEGWRFQLNQPAESTPMPDFDPANPPTAAASDSSDKADAAADTSDEDADDENDGTSIVWIGIAVAILLAVAIAVTLVRRRSGEDV